MYGTSGSPGVRLRSCLRWISADLTSARMNRSVNSIRPCSHALRVRCAYSEAMAKRSDETDELVARLRARGVKVDTPTPKETKVIFVGRKGAEALRKVSSKDT